MTGNSLHGTALTRQANLGGEYAYHLVVSWCAIGLDCCAVLVARILAALAYKMSAEAATHKQEVSADVIMRRLSR